jgi:large repetitive protein
MARLRLIGIVAATVAATIGSVAASVDAGAAVTTPGPPTSVRATSIAGVSGATVAWEPPESDGGSPVLFYVASTYTGNHYCTSFHPGSGTCHIEGLQVGAVRPSIRVRAVNGAGRGAVVVTFPVVTRANVVEGTPPASASSGSGPVAVGQITPTATSGTGEASRPQVNSGTTPGGRLPFSGSDVETLLVVGGALVGGGLLMLSPLGRRRLADEGTRHLIDGALHQ